MFKTVLVFALAAFAAAGGDGSETCGEDGLSLPDGFKDVTTFTGPFPEKADEAKGLPKVPLRVVDLQWLQVIGEGWAAPLRGFMREGVLLQVLHFNSIEVDTKGGADLHNIKTDFDNFNPKAQYFDRVSMSVPITLPITEETKKAIDGKDAVTLVAPNGEDIAILRNPEVYVHRKEELVARMYGHTDYEHPYVAENIIPAGDFLLGGEIELIKRVTFNDGLDEFRLTPNEIRGEFKKRGADTVVAFQTRNPTHAAHIWLMNDARRQLLEKGFKKPIVFLTPLGGWTKSDDVPLDVRIKQHHEVLKAGPPIGLDPETTVMGIWPSPMVYAGPTEVQWHCKARRNAGARYFITGRDPAGLKGSKNWQSSPLQKIIGEEDQYDGNHGRYVMQMSPGLGGLDVLSFGKVSYDITSDTMKPMDKKRKKDFLSISGSKMRKMAGKGTPVCDGKVTGDWNMECVPTGFMPSKAWDVVSDYYKNKDAKKWIQYAGDGM
jgi:3'-phosphoadenosine 5'-phosphosulfate synthase